MDYMDWMDPMDRIRSRPKSVLNLVYGGTKVLPRPFKAAVFFWFRTPGCASRNPGLGSFAPSGRMAAAVFLHQKLSFPNVRPCGATENMIPPSATEEATMV